MNILITGGAGFIGSHVADAYLSAGHQVTIIDNLSSGQMRNLPPQAQFYRLDLQGTQVEDLFKKNAFDVINHHAAQIDVRISMNDPVRDAHENILGSVYLLNLCRKFGVKKFIFASSGGAIYGEPLCFPAAEDHPEIPISPYGVAKLSVEKYMYWFSIQFGMNCIALRYANVYGPRQNSQGEAGVIAIFCNKAINHSAPKIFGDGLQTRDFVFVGDVARANFNALDLDGFHAINIGTGIETKVVEIANMINDKLNIDLKPIHEPAIPGEQRRSSIDPKQAQKILNWTPMTMLDQGLQLTIDYFQRLAQDNTIR